MTATAGPAWGDAAQALPAVFGDVPFELRFALHGRAAVRAVAPAGPVAPRHAEAPDPPAPWRVSARCGAAAGWLLAGRPPPAPERAHGILERAVERHTALVLQQLAEQRDAMTADLLDALTHRLRTDLVAFAAVVEGLAGGLFATEELEDVMGRMRAVGADAQDRLSRAGDVASVLTAERRAEPLLEVLQAELEATPKPLAVAAIDGERPMAFVPGRGWGTCSRLLAEALASDERLGSVAPAVAVSPVPAGWAVTAGTGMRGSAAPVAWTERLLGDLAHAGQIVTFAGGGAVAEHVGQALRVTLTVPAAPSG